MLTQDSDSKAVMHMKHLRHRLPRNNDRQGTHGRNKEVQNTKQEVNNGKQDMYYCMYELILLLLLLLLLFAMHSVHFTLNLHINTNICISIPKPS